MKRGGAHGSLSLIHIFLTELVEKGVQENDTILIGEYQFDYIF